MKEFIKKIRRKNIARSLDKQQKQVDKLYYEHGLTDEILSLQLKINCERNQNDIPDSNELIFEDYVQ